MPARKPVPHLRFTLSLALATIAASLSLWTAWCTFPAYDWNEARLAPAFALRLGINPYPLIGEGPLSTWIYGPVGIFINLPATFANSPANALHIASLVNFAVLFLPFAIIFFGSSELRARSAILKWTALMLAVLLIPGNNLLFQVPDHAAIAFGLLSCWLLAKPSRPSTAQLALAGACAALAIWAKQIAAFLVAAQFSYLLLRNERTNALKYFGWLFLGNFFALTIFVRAFGWENLWLNLVAIPGRLPWAGDLLAKLAIRPWALAAQILVPTAGLIVLWWKKKWPADDRESGRFFNLAVLAAAAMLPVGFAGYLKIGGDINILHSWNYLLPAGLLLWLTKISTSTFSRILFFVVTVAAVVLHWSDLSRLPYKPLIVHFDEAAHLTAAYPHAIWFPRNPIITIYADHVLWHSEDGVETRFLAHYGLREAEFRQHLPPDLQGVAYPKSFTPSFSMALLSELNVTTQIPHWTIHIRRRNPPASP